MKNLWALIAFVFDKETKLGKHLFYMVLKQVGFAEIMDRECVYIHAQITLPRPTLKHQCPWKDHGSKAQGCPHTC